MEHPEITAIEKNGMPSERDDKGELVWMDEPDEGINLTEFARDFFTLLSSATQR